MEKTKKLKIVRFNAKSDIILLKEVVARNPFVFPKMWAVIADTLVEEHEIEIDARRARERTMLMVDYYNRDDKAKLRKYV